MEELDEGSVGTTTELAGRDVSDDFFFSTGVVRESRTPRNLSTKEGEAGVLGVFEEPLESSELLRRVLELEFFGVSSLPLLLLLSLLLEFLSFVSELSELSELSEFSELRW